MKIRSKYVLYVTCLLFTLNLVNTIDRHIISGVAPLIKAEFNLSDTKAGLIGTAFMLTFSITAVPFGIWADRWIPQKVAAIGVLLWSAATAMGAFAYSFKSLFFWRSLVGVGEAAYAPAATSMMSRMYSVEDRSKVLAIYNLGLALGAAIGVVLGGYIGSIWGWRTAFLVVGLPGIFLAYLVWKIRLDYCDDTNQLEKVQLEKKPVTLAEIRNLFAIRTYTLIVLAFTGVSFAFGSYMFWLPTWLVREMGLHLGQAAKLMGIIMILAGLTGAPLGAWIADLWFKRNTRGRIYTMLIGTFASIPVTFLALWGGSNTLFFIGMFLSCFFLASIAAVAQAVIFDVTPKHLWATASALNVFIMHVLGDVPSPVITGWLSDLFTLSFALSTLPAAVLVAGIALIFAIKSVEPELQTELQNGN